MMLVPGQALASRMAWRNEPGPLSLVVMTVRVAGQTVTVKLHWLEFPDWSTAAQMTVVAPAGKAEPLAGMHVTAGLGSQLSRTTGAANVTTRVPKPDATLVP